MSVKDIFVPELVERITKAMLFFLKQMKNIITETTIAKFFSNDKISTRCLINTS